MTWTPEQIDQFLEMVLPCENEMEYQRALVHFAAENDRPAELGLEEGDQLLRRRAVRRSDYTGAVSSRASRIGKSFSWTENRILDWVERGSAESKNAITPAYIAVMLERLESEVVLELDKRQNVKFGVQGFDL